MAAVSSFFDPRSSSGRPRPPRLQHDGKAGGYSYVVGVRDSGGRFVPTPTSIPFGSKAVLDFGGIEGGWLSWAPFDDSKLRPLPYAAHEAAATVGPSPGQGHSLVVRLPVLLQQHGLAMWTLGGTIAQNAVQRIRTEYQNATEAAAGMIPVVTLGPSKQIALASRSGELHAAPELEIAGWVPRDDAVFGPRTVPPPTPILTGTEAAKLAAPSDDNAAPAAAGQPSLPRAAQPVQPVSTAAAAGQRIDPPQAANDAARIANDVFASMAPVSSVQGRPNF